MLLSILCTSSALHYLKQLGRVRFRAALVDYNAGFGHNRREHTGDLRRRTRVAYTLTVKAGDENVLIIAGVDTPQFSGEQQQHRIILVSGYGDPDEEGVDVDIAIPPRRGISLNAASEIILKAPKITFIGTVEIKGGDLLVRENVVCDKIVSDSTGSGVIAAP